MIELLQTKEVLAALILVGGAFITAISTVAVAWLKGWSERKAKEQDSKREAIEEYIELLYQIFIEKNHSTEMTQKYQTIGRRLTIGRVRRSTLNAIAVLENTPDNANDAFKKVITLLRDEVDLVTGEVPLGTFGN